MNSQLSPHPHLAMPWMRKLASTNGLPQGERYRKRCKGGRM
jgi:hypothetical protein